MVRPVLSLILAAAAAASATGQDAPTVLCRNCANHGVLECPKHRGTLELEQAVPFCSVAIDCKTCGGALQIDCKQCRNEAAERALAARQKQAADWLQARRKAVDELVEGQMLHLQTAHVDLAFGIRPMTVGKLKLDSHQLMHLYGQRIEALRQLFLATLEVPDQDVPARLQIFMFREQADHTLIAPRVTGMGGGASTGVKLMGAEAVWSMWHDLRSFADDEALHRTVVHNVAHLLVNNMQPPQYMPNRGLGWIDAGIAHWFEDKVTGRCANFCYEEVALLPGASFKGGRWRVPVRKLIEGGKPKAFAELSTLNTDQLSFEDHALAFAYVDFLLTARGGAKLRDLIRLVKQAQPKVSTRDALQQVYGLNPLSIDAEFRPWVTATYPLVEKD